VNKLAEEKQTRVESLDNAIKVLRDLALKTYGRSVTMKFRRGLVIDAINHLQYVKRLEELSKDEAIKLE
jgi:hypothetical protein